MGSAEGGMTGQIIGEQIGGTSKILEKMALASPFIHPYTLTPLLLYSANRSNFFILMYMLFEIDERE
jgi:hypothetical protein